MSRRDRRHCAWWGLIVLGGCLNPQPDTNPLSPEAVGSSPPVDVSPPAEPVAPALETPGLDGSATDPTPTDGLPPEPPRSAEGDAGAPADVDAGAASDRVPVTLSARDAGSLDPDAGAPSASGD